MIPLTTSPEGLDEDVYLLIRKKPSIMSEFSETFCLFMFSCGIQV